MDDYDEDAFSDASGGVEIGIDNRLNDELPIPVNEAVEDRTGHMDNLVSEDGSLASLLLLKDEISVVKPRTYQLEMLEKSLEENIIIAMDTGSGKTHIAVMRMLHELENSPEHQLIWFLATTISLCSQQYKYIQSQLASVQVKFLSGLDNIDSWSTQSRWDELLKNIRVVVSTHQIFLDALTHGFVQMDSLTMIVFDEAHNCVANHPGSVLMRNFYHDRKAKGLRVPKILGLTASPVMRSSPLSVSKIEQTLDAICRTPNKYRADLRLHVKLPSLIQVKYDVPAVPYTISVESLGQAFRGMNLKEDPYYLGLRTDKSERAQKNIQKLILNQKTSSRDQVKSFYTTSQRINEELGDWAADYYISHVVSKVRKMVDVADSQLGTWDISRREKEYVNKILQKVKVIDSPTEIFLPSVTNKVAKLIEVLLEGGGQPSGIIFVKERATAFMLAQLLRFHPQTGGEFKVGTVVGTSQHSKRVGKISEFVDTDLRGDALDMFRDGELDLIIATSVLEEGLDVPGCNLVICFEKPANLKSFVQRRGRARHHDSKLILLLDSQGQKLQDWQQLEADMKAIYEDEKRVLEAKLVEQNAEKHDGRMFRIERTNATLDLDNAVAHLYHFCAVLSSKAYVDNRPDFICTEENGLTHAKVVLPISVHADVRVAESQGMWSNEKNAIKDAAFRAYVALYNAGLVNDNLLPLHEGDAIGDELMASAVETRASIMEVNQQLNPWIDIARCWKSDEAIEAFRCKITIGTLEIQMYLPVEIPRVNPFKIYWDAKTQLIVTPSQESVRADPGELVSAGNDTWALLQAAFGAHIPVERKQVVMQFLANHSLPLDSLLGREPAANQELLSNSSGLVRNEDASQVPYVFQQLLSTKPSTREVQQPYADYETVPENTPHFSLKRFTKRRDLLHKVSPSDKSPSTKSYSAVLPVSRCTVDEMPFKFVQFALMIPAIMHRYEVHLIAERLSNTLLKDIQISDLSLVVTAICASSAREETNYQRLEFLGDCILKMCTSVELTSKHLIWPEGYLSSMKDRIVANSRLSRAAVDTGLDRFIITKSFTGLKWRPLYVDSLAQMENDGKRPVSSKVLADVVEALVGAAMVDGGLPKALACLAVFLPELNWDPLSSCRDSLYHRSPDAEFPSTLAPLETLIGYTFQKKALLKDATTHASYHSGSSLERFEFLGDSLLDYLVVTEMYPHNLSQVQMHLLRTALVNADFLAFICMEWSISHEITSFATSPDPSQPIIKTTSNVKTPLWAFMRHASSTLGAVQTATSKRHAELRGDINEAIDNGRYYPWALLAGLQAQKFYSDLIESLLGAVWIDSGSLEICRDMLERMGILVYMRRILSEGVHVWHPKEELGIYADTEKVKYVLEVVSASAEGANGNGNGNGSSEAKNTEYSCTVFVGEEEVVRVKGGVSKEEVHTRAAEQAVAIMRERKERVVDKGKMGGVIYAAVEKEGRDDEMMGGC